MSGLFVSSSALAQAQPTGTCELHVWANAHIDVDVSGIFPGGILAEVENAPYNEKLSRGKSNIVKDLMTPELIMAAVKESAIGSRLKIAQDKFILEADPASQRTFAKMATRSDEPCSYGFYFKTIQFQKSTVYGRTLQVYYSITDRTTRPKPRNMSWYNGEKISAFDPTQSNEQIAGVLRDGLRRVIDDIVRKKFPVEQGN